MSVGREHAERIAVLARLQFGAEELERLTEELNHILQHVEALRSLEDGPAAVHSELPPLRLGSEARLEAVRQKWLTL